MMLFSNHLSAETLMDLAEGRFEEVARTEAERHLVNCQRCTAALTAYRRMIQTMRSDELQSAPPAVIARALQLFKPLTVANPTRRSLLGVLRFDSATQLTPAFSLRAGQTAGRQLLYNVAEFDIDLRIEPSGTDWTLSGQLLGDVSPGVADLIGPTQRFASELNDLGEFHFSPVPDGEYQLRIALSDTDIAIPALTLEV